MSRKTMAMAMVTAITGASVMFSGQAFAAAKPTAVPQPISAKQAAAAKQQKELLIEARRKGLTSRERIALLIKAKEAGVPVPVTAAAPFTG